MAEKGTAFQTGGGGTNFEQFIQAFFLVAMLLKGNAPALPSNKVTELVLQSSTRGWATDDLLVSAKSKLQQNTIGSDKNNFVVEHVIRQQIEKDFHVH